MEVRYHNLEVQWESLREDIQQTIETIYQNREQSHKSILESNLCSMFHVQSAMCTSTTMVAMVATLRGLNIGPGSFVAIQADSPIEIVQAVSQVGATVELVRQWGLGSFNPKWNVCIPSYSYGNIHEQTIMFLRDICFKNHIWLIEDATAALGAKNIGQYGVAAILSFDEGSNLGSIARGGCVLTNNGALDNFLHDYFYGSTYLPYSSDGYMTAIQAVICDIGLQKLKEWNSSRQFIAAEYQQFVDSKKIHRPEGITSNCVHNTYPIILNSVDEQGDLLQCLFEHDIHIKYNPFLPSEYQQFRTPMLDLEFASARTILLPICPTMTEQQINYVIETVLEWRNQ